MKDEDNIGWYNIYWVGIGIRDLEKGEGDMIKYEESFIERYDGVRKS